jgi:hypothetical protein
VKFGKRQKKDPDADPGAPGPDPVAADHAPDPVAEVAEVAEPPSAAPDSPFAASWTQAAPVPVPEPEPEPYAPEPEPAIHDEPVVEGEAFELFTDEPPAPDPVPAETLSVHQHTPPPPPEPMPFPVAEQPVAVVSPGAAAAPVTSLGDAGQAFASGHAAGPSHGPGPGPSWQEPVMELANERPELVVGAAFAGGLLAAMILRRFGN